MVQHGGRFLDVAGNRSSVGARPHGTRGEGATVFVCAVAILAVLGCQPGTPEATPSDPVTLFIGFPAPTNPTGQAVGVRPLLSLISDEGLVRTAPDGRHEPELASRWEVSDGGQTLTFHLRPGARFGDGEALTADAVKASLDTSRANPSVLAQYPLLTDITAVEVLDPTRLRVSLDQPSALALDDLAVPISKPTSDGRTVGPGPYALESEGTDTAVLRANPHYHGEPQTIEVINIRTYRDVRTAWAAMMRGEIDFLYQVPSDAREFIEAESRVRVYSFLRPYAYMLVFNTLRPQFRSASVRRALNFAVDRQAILERALGGHGRDASSLVWPLHWAYRGEETGYTHDPHRADEILTREGFSRPSASGWSGNEMPARMRFRCLVAADYWPFEDMALLLQQQLYDVGIDMQVDAVSIQTFLRQLQTGDYDAALLDLNGGPGLVRPYTFWHSGETHPWQFGYSGADDALDALRSAPDESTMRAAALRFRRTLIDDPPAIFLAWAERARAVSQRFRVPDTDRDIVTTIAQWRLSDASAPPSP